MATVPVPSRVESIEEKFQRLATVWDQAVAHHSSSTLRNNHPAYQEIIGMGWEVVPLLLRDLARQGTHWFWALHVITGADPVAPVDRGDFDQVVEAWLSWGRAKGYH